MRFASSMFDRYKSKLGAIDDFPTLERYLERLDLRSKFLDYAAAQGIRITPSETETFDTYMMPQIRALVGRYSKLDDEAFYRFYLEIDETLAAAMKADMSVLDTDSDTAE